MTASELTDSEEPTLPPATADAWAVVYMDVEDKLDSSLVPNCDEKAVQQGTGDEFRPSDCPPRNLGGVEYLRFDCDC